MKRIMIVSALLVILLSSCFVMIPEQSVTIAMMGTDVWLDTGVSVYSSDSVEISASGGISLNIESFPNFDVGPDGMTEFGTPQSADSANADLYPIPASVIGILIGNVGLNGTPFVIGKSSSFKNKGSGKLYIMANDYPPDNNGGSWSVVITVSRQLF